MRCVAALLPFWAAVAIALAAWAQDPQGHRLNPFVPYPPPPETDVPTIAGVGSSGQYGPLEVGSRVAGRSWQEYVSSGPAELGSTTPMHVAPAEPSWAGADQAWSWQLLPEGLVYRSYLAGVKEPRFASVWSYDERLGSIWDGALGGRVGVLRFGTTDSVQPEGWQLDFEGAVLPRIAWDHDRDLVTVDFRYGVPITYGRGRFQTKLAFYHLSSHMGDEWMIRQQTLSRINYSRNAVVWGNSWFITPAIRLYGEAGWAYYIDGGSKPWEFQFGADYSPARAEGYRGAPFLAVNSQLRQELDFGGNFVVQTGWQWRGAAGHLFRLGLQYYAGASDQFETFRQYENKVGLGLWYDY